MTLKLFGRALIYAFLLIGATIALEMILDAAGIAQRLRDIAGYAVLLGGGLALSVHMSKRRLRP